MMTILLTTNLMMSITFITLKHPLSMGLTLLIQTTLISMITGNFFLNFWFSYIIFLIMIGGMLILFMYMTSIASNEKFKTNLKMLMMIIPLPAMALMIHPYTKTPIMNNETLKISESMEMSSSLTKYVNLPLSMTLIFMMMYLLLALIATVKITNFSQGSIRQMN